MTRPRVNVAALLVAILVVAGPLLLMPRPAAARVGDAPRVAVIVGPVGSLTSEYRRIGREAAVEARRWTPDVVTVFSPYATWPAVKAAISGASVVIYLGHGNGWPSPYRSALYDVTQNGFGLNPTSGDGDYAHQYFGADYLRREVNLAPGAVVIFHRLCYASGNSEPGVPEGTLSMAEKRVDNYAAGFLDIGAGAVIADAFASPVGYLRRLFGDGSPPIVAWRKAPTANGHIFSFDSTRTAGALAFMDPDTDSSGFYRSIVISPTAARTTGPAGVGTGEGTSVPNAIAPVIVKPTDPTPPSLAAMGATSGTPVFTDRPIAAATTTLTVPLALPVGTSLPAGIQVGVRWTPIDVAPVIAADQPGSPGASPDPSVSSAPGTPPDPGASPSPSASAPSPSPAASPSSPPDVTPTPSPTPAPGTARHPTSAAATRPGTSPARPGRVAGASAGGHGAGGAATPAPAVVEPTATPAPSASAAPSPSPTPYQGATPTPDPSITPDPGATPTIGATTDPGIGTGEDIAGTDQVVPEASSATVEVAPATVIPGGLRLAVHLPRTPGRYRMVVTLHGRDGVALDAETQALVPALLVRVAGPLEVAYKTAASVQAATGSSMRLLVTVTNAGTLSWRGSVGARVDAAGRKSLDGPRVVDPRPTLVGRWVALDAGGSAADALAAEVPFDAAPGRSAAVVLSLRAPSLPGTYLVVLDVRSPVYGSLAAHGATPATIVVIVAQP